MFTKSPLRWALVTSSVAVFLIGCGAKTTRFVSSTSSRGTTVVTGSSYLLAECNRVSLSSIGLTGQIGTYYDRTTRQYRSDYTNLNITAAPSALFSSSTYIIQIFRWYERSAGSKQVNQIPVKMFFVDKLNGTTTPAAMVDRLSLATIQAAYNVLKPGFINVSLSQFFDRVMVVLTGMDSQYDALTFAAYDTATSTYSFAQTNVLLTPFYSNPNVYQTYNPGGTDLLPLHPNYASRSSGGTENDYYQLIQPICSDLAGLGSRVPASIPEPKSLIQTIWNRIIESLEFIFF